MIHCSIAVTVSNCVYKNHLYYATTKITFVSIKTLPNQILKGHNRHLGKIFIEDTYQCKDFFHYLCNIYLQENEGKRGFDVNKLKVNSCNIPYKEKNIGLVKILNKGRKTYHS